jgi:hypothetical protein
MSQLTTDARYDCVKKCFREISISLQDSEDWFYRGGHTSERTMTPKFGIDELLFNRNTNEKGTVGRVYELNGVTMYEVNVSVDFRGLSIGVNVSDWAEDALELASGRVRGRNPFFN